MGCHYPMASILAHSTFLREHVISEKIHHSIITELEKANGHYILGQNNTAFLFFSFEMKILSLKIIHKEEIV